MGFKVLMAIIVAITVFWDVMSYSLVDGHQHLGGTFFLHLQAV
jgi:hypothetical protein